MDDSDVTTAKCRLARKAIDACCDSTSIRTISFESNFNCSHSILGQTGKPKKIHDLEYRFFQLTLRENSARFLPPHVGNPLVVTQRDEARVAQVQVGGPFDEFELTDERGP